MNHSIIGVNLKELITGRAWLIQTWLYLSSTFIKHFGHIFPIRSLPVIFWSMIEYFQWQ